MRAEGEIRIPRPYGLVWRARRFIVEPVEPMSPPAHDNEITVPWSQSVKQFAISSRLSTLSSTSAFVMNQLTNNSIANHVGLLLPASRMRRHVEPDL
jgi:hypothetical protein